MSPTLRRVAVVVATGAVAVLAPVASASATPTPFVAPNPGLALPAFHLPALPALPGFTPGRLNFVGPAVGQVAAVIGPTVLTTAPSNFANTNIQVSAGGNASGGQAGP